MICDHPILIFLIVVCLSSLSHSAWFHDATPSCQLSLSIAPAIFGNNERAANQHNFWGSAAQFRQRSPCTAFVPMNVEAIFQRVFHPMEHSLMPSCCQQVAKTGFSTGERKWQTLRNGGRSHQKLVLLASRYRDSSYDSRDDSGRVNPREKQRRNPDFHDTKQFGKNSRGEDYDSASFQRVTLHSNI